MLKKEEFIKQVTVHPFTATDGTQWYTGKFNGHVYSFAKFKDILPQLCRETYCKDMFSRQEDDEVFFDQMDKY